MNDWIPTSERLPADHHLVQTKVVTEGVTSNETKLRYEGGQWLTPLRQPVIATPTHWRAES